MARKTNDDDKQVEHNSFLLINMNEMIRLRIFHLTYFCLQLNCDSNAIKQTQIDKGMQI